MQEIPNKKRKFLGIALPSTFWLFVFIATPVIYILVLQALSLQGTNHSLYTDSIPNSALENNVEMSIAGKSKTVDLPAKLPYARYYSYSFVPSDYGIKENLCFSIKTKYLSFIISSGKDKIYSYFPGKTSSIKSGAADFNLIDIPSKYIDKNISVKYFSNIGEAISYPYRH